MVITGTDAYALYDGMQTRDESAPMIGDQLLVSVRYIRVDKPH